MSWQTPSVLYSVKWRKLYPSRKGVGCGAALLTSTLALVVNVDLPMKNATVELLLSWRRDTYCGIGWYIPGGCICY